MREETIKVYQFNELSDEAKSKAIASMADINTDYDWYQCTYGDAENIGLKITGFDIDRGSYCSGKFIESPEETAEKIKSEHGPDCETWKTADRYLQYRAALVKKFSDGINTDQVSQDNYYEFDEECDELDGDFLKLLCEDYRIILQKEYEYQTSKEQIIETIECNEYEFLADGSRYWFDTSGRPGDLPEVSNQ